MKPAVVAVVLLAVACAARAGPGVKGPSAVQRPAAEPTALSGATPTASPWGDTGEPLARAVLDSFAAPGTAAMGVDWVGPQGVLYHVDEVLGEVYAISPAGVATYLFRMGPQIGYPLATDIGNGICHVETGRGEYLYVTDFGGHLDDPVDRVYQFELDGTLVGSWNVESVADQVVGICFDGQSFWLQSSARMEIVRCDTLFQTTAVFDHPMPNADSAGGLDHDPDTGLYYVSERWFGSVYVCDSGMNVVDLFVTHPTALRMAGVAVGRATRGRSLWTSSYGPVESHVDATIYEVDDVYYNETEVEPATWGTIKATFRR
ncbi:MAG: hypothetical protein ABIG03_00795 [Candidatus Eisenbacteria bacterium]